jgi:hypothetical protein
VEYNGLYWHKFRFNNRTLKEYEQDMINEYKNVGIDCLVVWDFQLEKNRAFILQKIENFIDN